MMKKAVGGILALLLALSFSACAQEKNVDINTAADTVMKEVHFSETLAEIDREAACSLYDIPEDWVKNVRVFIGSGATVDEAAFFELNDASNMPQLEARVQARIAAQKEGYRNYRPEEVPKLEGAVTVTAGSRLIVCVTADSNAKRVIDDNIK